MWHPVFHTFFFYFISPLSPTRDFLSILMFSTFSIWPFSPVFFSHVVRFSFISWNSLNIYFVVVVVVLNRKRKRDSVHNVEDVTKQCSKVFLMFYVGWEEW